MMEVRKRKPLIVDVHIPYCVKPEKYLHHAYAVGSNEEKNAYMSALARELESYQDDISKEYEVRAVRLSGGSATVMKPDLLGGLLRGIRKHFPMAPGAEVSFDAHPLTIGTPSLTGISAGLPNRAQLMMRSFDDSELKTLGCSFDTQTVNNAMLFFHRFHLNNVGLTVNYGIPGQSMVSWHNTLHACVIMNPAQISVERVDEIPAQNVLAPDLLENMYREACTYLTASGYAQYSATGFCLPMHEYRFEVERMNGCECIGVGAGATSLWSGYLIMNTPNRFQYIKNAGDYEKITARVLSADENLLMDNYFYGRMQMTQGLVMEDFERRFSQPLPENLQQKLDTFIEKGWAQEQTEGHYTPTQEGLFHNRDLTA